MVSASMVLVLWNRRKGGSLADTGFATAASLLGSTITLALSALVPLQAWFLGPRHHSLYAAAQPETKLGGLRLSRISFTEINNVFS
jgi:uncharacterized membrane protein YbhN (UPF0104 family)